MAPLTLRADSSPPVWSAEHPHAVIAFSTRIGGVSEAPYDTLNLGRSTADRPEAVTENRGRILSALGLSSQRLTTAGQTHGVRVERALEPGLIPDCDALLSTVPDLALAVTAADCLPVVLVAPGAVAAVHSGWRGAAAGIPAAALVAVCEAAHVGPGEVEAYFGPGIRPCCYRVGPEVAAQFPAEVTRRDGDRHRLDIAAAVFLGLVQGGVTPSRITDCGECTACRPDRYFSHRRDGGRTGRHWAVAALRGDMP